ncbi:MAG: hypothetical protein V4724_17945 [Pseudomonadota bacterium]
MFKQWFAAAMLCCISGAPLAQTPKELVGTYQMEVADGDILQLRADGSASLAGEESTWTAKNGQLRLGNETIPYRMNNGHLVLTMGPVQMSWKRINAGGAAATPLQRAAERAARAGGGNGASPGRSSNADDAAMAGGGAQSGSPQDTQSREVLMSTAWCSFTYSKVSGTSTTRRVVFRRDGTLTVAGGAETYSSGYGGTVSGQSSNASTMRWSFQNQRLYIDQGAGQGMQDVGLTATRNSNGSIILHADGREYSMCR